MPLASLRCNSARFVDERLNQKVKIATSKNLTAQSGRQNLTVKIKVSVLQKFMDFRIEFFFSLFIYFFIFYTFQIHRRIPRANLRRNVQLQHMADFRIEMAVSYTAGVSASQALQPRAPEKCSLNERFIETRPVILPVHGSRLLLHHEY